MRPEDEDFISQATQNGFDESFYLPAIASKKMRQQDIELEKKYQSYKASPTTFMSQFKNEYGKEDRGIVGDTLGFIGNLFTDTAESVEDIGRAVLNPVETVKWVAGLFSKSGMKAVKGALAENFGSIEKAKETFYENPFDVLSVVLPIAKIGTAGKLGKMAKATKLWKAVESSKYAGTINKLADLTNWDINLMKWAAKTAWGAIGWTKNLATEAFSKLALGNSWATGKILDRASTPAGRQWITKMMEMWEPQMIRNIEQTIPKIEEAVGKETFTAATESKQLGSLPAPETFVEWPISARKLTNPTTETWALFSDTGVKTDFKIKPKEGGVYLELSEEWIEKTPEAIKAEQTINDVLKETNFTDFLKDFDPVKGSQVLKKLNARMAGSGELGGIAMDTANRVKQFSKWIRDAQTTVYPLIKRARKEAREVSDLMKDFKKEISLNAKDSTIINRVKGVLGNEITNKAVKYINKEGGLNLEDMAIALTAKQPLSTVSRTAFNIAMGAWAGALIGSGVGIPMLIGAVGSWLITSPFVLVRILKDIGWPLRQGKNAAKAYISKLSKATKIPEADLVKAAQKIAENPKEVDNYLNMAWEILKWTATSPKTATWLEKINRNVQEQYMNESNELKWDISEMEQEVQKWVESKVQNMPTDYESQFTEPLPEWAYINPDYL
jgi:hypothetical protein